MKTLYTILIVFPLAWWSFYFLDIYPTRKAELLLSKVDDIDTPSDDPGVYNLSGIPLPITSTSRMLYIGNDSLIDNFARGYQPFQMDRVGRLLGQCIPTNKKLKAGLPYSRMYFRINDIN